MRELYIGGMSGTSQDGVDVVLVEFSAAGSNIHQATTTPYTGKLGKRIKNLITQPQVTLQELGEVNVAIGKFFGQCILKLLEPSDFGAHEITAIGHSGHTVYHKPEEPDAFTMQIGDSSTIAANTGITTVGNFRNMDMAFGGQGAPLAPAFHEWCFSDTKESRIVVNIGGIANISVLQPKLPLLGFDTGPGNTLLDNWTHRCTGKSFDHNGDWSKTGQINKPLLLALKKDKYFERSPPKSTGLEHFNLAWLEGELREINRTLPDEDVQATLTELTAETIADAIVSTNGDPQRVILCGGGVLNTALVERLSELLPSIELESSAEYGIGPEWVEAVMFAWLARARLKGRSGNAPTVTGARQVTPLGGVYFGAT